MPVSAEKRELMEKRVGPYKIQLEELKKNIAFAKSEAAKNKKMQPFWLIKSAAHSIACTNTYVLMSEVAERIQGAKNNTYLNHARKELSSCISDLNKIFGENLTSSLTEEQELIENISQIETVHKLHFIKEVRAAIEGIKTALGEKSKWRWSFPDMHYRFITFAKNWFDFKLLQRTKDPNDPLYRPLQDYIDFLMEEAQTAAQEFRSRHELSTQEIDDLHKIRDIFEMQKNIYILEGNEEGRSRLVTSLNNIAEKIEALIAKKDKGLDSKSLE